MLILITTFLGLWSSLQDPPTKSEPVWFWFATCGGPAMTVEVKAESRVLQKLVVPVCRGPRNASTAQGQTAGRVDFVFRTERPIVWEGYRDTKDRTRAGDVIEASLWQAGAEPDAMLIGVSFSAPDRIVMNTIHIARPDRRDESTIAPGVTVTTYPSR